MKSKLTRTNLAVVALAMLMASFAPAAHADKCSTQTVAGDWAFTLTGSGLGGKPHLRAEVLKRRNYETEIRVLQTKPEYQRRRLYLDHVGAIDMH